MKLRKKFDIRKWQKANDEKREEWLKHWRVIKWHPLPWFVVLVLSAYAFEYFNQV